MKEIITVAIILLILGSAVFSIVFQRKKGNKCMGCACCPLAGKCGKQPGDK